MQDRERGGLKSSYDDIISVVDFFPIGIKAIQEVGGWEGGLCWKINLIWSHFIRISLPAYELFSQPLYIIYIYIWQIRHSKKLKY